MAITNISKKSKAAKAQKVKPLIFVIEDDNLQLEILKDHLESTTAECEIKVFQVCLSRKEVAFSLLNMFKRAAVTF